jgi:hypothetical protein
LCRSFPPEVKVAAEKAAEEDHRSLSSYIEKLLIEQLRKKDYLPKAEIVAHNSDAYSAVLYGLRLRLIRPTKRAVSQRGEHAVRALPTLQIG